LLGALAGVACFVLAGRAKSQVGPYLAAALMFVAGYAGLAISIFPYVVPYALTIWDTAAADNSLGLMLVGVVILLPVILGYTAYVYWLFRGKATAESAYH
jgi:cytochrome d ubiquinol oxidase subunit II